MTLDGDRVGLVLGGGGLTGLAFHAGVLLALATDARWDARRSQVLVGTSAGAVAAALVRLGLSGHDLAAVVAGLDAEEVPDALPTQWRPATDPPPSLWRRALGFPSLPAPAAVLAAVRDIGRHGNPLRLLAALAPRRAAGLDEMLPVLAVPWPKEPLLITAVDGPTLQRVVFHRDGPATLDDAVAASCALPGVAAPRDIAGRPHLDGGIHSPTNADLLRDVGLQRVIVSSPMTGAVTRFHPGGILVRLARQRLDLELATLRAAGLGAVVVEPDRETRLQMGHDPLRGARTAATLRAAYFAAGRLLRENGLTARTGR